MPNGPGAPTGGAAEIDRFPNGMVVDGHPNPDVVTPAQMGAVDPNGDSII
jgi:hypothetical protein